MSSLEGWNLDTRPVVKETLLSRKPARASVPVALGSVAVLVAVSLAYWSNAAGLASVLPASEEAVFARGEYWRLFTTLLTHADFQHLLSNGIVFGILAFLLYGYYGPLVYPFLTFALGALVTALSLRTYPPDTFLLGASGVVYLMAAFWLTLYLLVERSTALRMRLVRAVGFGLIVLVPTAVEPTVSYRTHVIGFGVGIAFGIAYFWKRKEALRSAERIELE
jgi:membrane associated rhomboid family serine protease